MDEIAPGLWHWTARHPHIDADVSSYYLLPERVLLDPMIPPAGAEWFAGREPLQIVLTNRHHDRDSWRLRAEFGCQVHSLAVADGIVRSPGVDGLTFVPDWLMDDPQNTKRGLRAAYRSLLELDFDRLLLAHGEPVVAGARQAVSAFADG
ncbi:MAG: hypothetical protein ACLP50_34575 [Solirubrobacteraceae bacterium]